MGEKLIVCPACNGTGQADKVDRGPFTHGTCEPCGTSGWVSPSTLRRERAALSREEGR